MRNIKSGLRIFIIAVLLYCLIMPAPSLALISNYSTGNFTDPVQPDYSARQEINSYTKSVIENMNMARDTSNDMYYDKAEVALGNILKIDPANYDALRLKAWIQSGRHQFKEALYSATQASKIRPSDSSNYGVMVDSLIELGHYDEAVDAAQKMVDLKPSMAAFSRIAYIRWLYGQPDSSNEMMKKAISAGRPGAPETAWCIVQLGNNYFNQGHLDAAEEQYRRALQVSPNYIHAFAGLGKVKAARKEYKGAITLYQKATSKNPTHAYNSALSELYKITGDNRRASEQFKLVEQMAGRRQSNPETGLKMAIFYLDQNKNLPQALELAKKDAGSSDDIPAWDTLAWAYYKNGLYSDANKAMKKALRLGTKDAKLFFHAGMIYRAQGNNKQAKKYLETALATNPYFDLEGPGLARATLREIDAGVDQSALWRAITIILILASIALAFITLRPQKARSPQQ